jgi:hypothetical protein
MSFLQLFRRTVIMTGILLLSNSVAFSLNPPQSLSPEQIVRKAVARAQAAQHQSQRADYEYTKRVTVQEFDAHGRVTETKEKLFRFRSGLGSLEQIKINGQTAGSDRLKKEEERALRQSSQLVDSKTAKRDDNWEKYLTPDLVAKYRFALRDRKLLNGRPAYVITFEPWSPNLPVRQMADHLLNQLAGTVWIDEQEFEIAHAEIFAQSKVTLGGVMELFGSLKSFSYALDRIRLPEGAWFNRLTKGDFEGRKLLDVTHMKTRSETSDFRRLSAQKTD